MPSIAQQPILNPSGGFMIKDRAGEPSKTGFTAVNGRTSPPSPRKANGVNGMNGMNGMNMSSDTIHVKPLLRTSTEDLQEQKVPLPAGDDWNQSGRRTNSPPSPPNGYGKRKRSGSVEEEHSYQHNEVDSALPRRRLSIDRDDTPHAVSRNQPGPIEGPREYPPMEHPEHDRSWAARDPRETVHNTTSELPHRDSRGFDSLDRANTSPPNGSLSMGSVDSPISVERSNTTEVTRAGVQVDPKKRKRVRHFWSTKNFSLIE